MQGLIARLLLAARSERGQTMVEYALVLMLVAIVVLTALRLIADRTDNAFTVITNAVDNVM